MSNARVSLVGYLPYLNPQLMTLVMTANYGQTAYGKHWLSDKYQVNFMPSRKPPAASDIAKNSAGRRSGAHQPLRDEEKQQAPVEVAPSSPRLRALWNSVSAVLLIISVLLLAPSEANAAAIKETQQAKTEQQRRAELAKIDGDTIKTLRRSEQREMLLSVVLDMYAKRQYKPLWYTDKQFSAKGEAALDLLNSFEALGLRQASLKKFRAQQQSTPLMAYDIELTTRLLLNAVAIHIGSEHWGAELAPPLAIELIKQILKTENPAHLLNSWQSLHPGYKHLQQALLNYRSIERQGGWEPFITRRILSAGKRSKKVPELRERLAAEGYSVGATTEDETCFDDNLVEQVKLFQRRHGLTVDGRVPIATRRAMNVPVAERIAQIERSMVKFFKLPRDMGEHFIWVNVPGYQLQVIQDEKVTLEMPVIVGKKKHATPTFGDKIEYIEVNPYWYVPNSIAKNEIIPKLQRDRGYLKKQNMRVFSRKTGKMLSPYKVRWRKSRSREYRFRQEPGPKNALGRAKFIFPNRHSVFLHDTPNHRPFANAMRSLSHGCVRVSEPLKLAQHVLENRHYKDFDLDAVLETGKPTRLYLDAPLPVYLSYHTAWATPDGSVNFAKDIYELDQSYELPNSAIVALGRLAQPKQQMLAASEESGGTVLQHPMASEDWP